MTQENVELSLLRGAVIPTALTGVIAMGLSAFIAGMPGFLGALLAISTMGLALFSYTTKLLFVGVFLWLLTTYTDRESINRTSFGVTAILLTLSWLGGEIASYTKLRIHLPLPGASSSNSGNESEGEK